MNLGNTATTLSEVLRARPIPVFGAGIELATSVQAWAATVAPALCI